MRINLWLLLLQFSVFVFASDSSSSSSDDDSSSSDSESPSSQNVFNGDEEMSIMSLTENVADTSNGIDHFSDDDDEDDDSSVMDVELPHVDFEKKFDPAGKFNLPVVEGSLTPDDIPKFQQIFEQSRPEDDQIGGLVGRLGVENIIENVVNKDEDYFNFEVVLPKEFTASNQHRSFCCALFPILSLSRLRLAKQFKLPANFEFSAWHILQFDYLEKANAFLESFYAHIDKDLESDELADLLFLNIESSSLWCTNKRLIEKYGLVPKTVKPDNENVKDIYETLTLVQQIINSSALKMHEIYHKSNGGDIEGVQREKSEAKQKVYNSLVLAFGKPIYGEFTWNFTDKDKKVHSYTYDSPRTFYEAHIKESLDQLVGLSNFPNLNSPCHYNILYRQKIFELNCRDVLNVSNDDFEEYAKQAILKQWPAIYVGYWTSYRYGLMDDGLVNKGAVFGDNVPQIDQQALSSSQNKYPIHSQLLCGLSYDFEDRNRIRKWRAENSWGTRTGKDGYYCITRSWFKKYVFELVVPKFVLSPEHAQLFDAPPEIIES